MTDPYTAGMVSKDPFFKKQPVEGTIVAVLSNKFDKRGVKLMPQPSRAVLKNEIHELMLTDEAAAPNVTVDRIFCLGFFEISCPGVVVKGDTLTVAGRPIGTVAGFNGDHMPNHLNIVIYTKTPKTGEEMAIGLSESIRLEKIRGYTTLITNNQ